MSTTGRPRTSRPPAIAWRPSYFSSGSTGLREGRNARRAPVQKRAPAACIGRGWRHWIGGEQKSLAIRASRAVSAVRRPERSRLGYPRRRLPCRPHRPRRSPRSGDGGADSIPAAGRRPSVARGDGAPSGTRPRDARRAVSGRGRRPHALDSPRVAAPPASSRSVLSIPGRRGARRGAASRAALGAWRPDHDDESDLAPPAASSRGARGGLPCDARPGGRFALQPTGWPRMARRAVPRCGSR